MFEIFHTIFRYKEKESPDELGLFPERVHVDAIPERRYLWTSRVLVIISCLSICFNMMLAAVIYIMLPQRTVAPQFLTINKYFSQLEMVQPSEIYYPVSDLVTEANVRDYIIRRYLISNDYDEMLDRWRVDSVFYWFSSPSLYKDFIKFEAVNNLRLFRERSMLRNVEIDWARPMARNLWQVQFSTTDVYPERDYSYTTVWRATLRIGYFNIKHAKRDDAILNPYGFLVVGYSLSFHSNPESSQSYMETVKKITEDYYR